MAGCQGLLLSCSEAERGTSTAIELVVPGVAPSVLPEERQLAGSAPDISVESLSSDMPRVALSSLECHCGLYDTESTGRRPGSSR